MTSLFVLLLYPELKSSDHQAPPPLQEKERDAFRPKVMPLVSEKEAQKLGGLGRKRNCCCLLGVGEELGN